MDAADGTLLGLVDAVLLARDGAARPHRHNRPFETKESRRWLDATRQAAELLAAGASRVTMIADREADIYEVFARHPAGVDVLVRVHHDRCLVDGGSLYDGVAELVELGREEVDLPAAPGRRARRASLALRARRVVIARPRRNLAEEAARLPPSTGPWLLEAREIDPPAGATPILWRLPATHDVATLAEARRITGFYRQRWSIEQLFRVMKTKGFDIEANRLAEGGPFENLATATPVAAVQVRQMPRDRDGHAARPMEDVFEPQDRPALEAIARALEGSTARQKNPHPPGSLAFAAWVCARLGGWTGYGGKPGPVVLVQGYHRLQAMIEGWNIRGIV